MSYIGSTPTSQAFAPGTDTFSGTGSQVAFTLSRNVATVNDILVVVNNVDQQPTAYTVANNTLTFSAAPSSGTNNIYVRYLSTNLQTIAPQQGSVTKQALDVGSGGVGTGAMQLPSGTTAERPSAPLVGYTRYNTSTVSLENWNGTSWVPVGANINSISYLVVAGGGGGGNAVVGNYYAGGGGAGGLLTGSVIATTGNVFSATVGAGGAAATNGSNSTLSGAGLSLTAVGGGAGGSGAAGAAGGSGGGGGGVIGTRAGGAGTAGQGNNGATSVANYVSGGGGGAGFVGGTGATQRGGNGLASSITGASVYYAGGGTGSDNVYTSLGGGGAGALSSAATAGTANTGGGGGAGTASAGLTTGAAGGSGVIILSVLTSLYTGTVTGSPTVTTSGAYTIITWTSSSGTYTA